ncbi:hypothetical protein PCC7424_0576 [Gloeothece citriformis PCC 7424]|uniref:Uncharacterized protein n=1 Tax=Gloeothece citriformis (strain PCC 7424) TaxID=65393 RepID=B7KEL3_GLOC7|nr:hypothetical protein [Gloeothece citriformis]ACK69038.1 hypothetical protein PCC7424_0576 [Gloeothece citriformis PCC 7424]
MIQDIMEKIESYEFSAILGIASSFQVFKQIMSKQEIVIELTKNINNSPENQWLVFQRTVALSQKKIDSQT